MGELFIMGRVGVKDLIIVDGRHHYRDNIARRVAAVSLENGRTENLVTSTISNSCSLGAVDLFLVSSGSIPITRSGKVRRSACAERYRQNEFERLDVSA
jgi:long chain fatty acid CoA FadD26